MAMSSALRAIRSIGQAAQLPWVHTTHTQSEVSKRLPQARTPFVLKPNGVADRVGYRVFHHGHHKHAVAPRAGYGGCRGGGCMDSQTRDLKALNDRRTVGSRELPIPLATGYPARAAGIARRAVQYA